MEELLTASDLLDYEFHGNQSELSRVLKVSRKTLRKYINDPTGDRHQIRVFDGEYQLMVKTHGSHR